MSDLLKKTEEYVNSLTIIGDLSHSEEEMKSYSRTDFVAGYSLCQKEYEEKLRWIPIEEKKPEIKEEQYQIQVLNRKNDIQVIWFGTEYDLTFINRFKAWRYFL